MYKIAIIGPESTGKTMLAEQLAIIIIRGFPSMRGLTSKACQGRIILMISNTSP